MKNTLRFDGPRLEDVLDRVQRELGTDATIVDATRTRRGGIAGFFSREWFEVVVEHDAPAPESSGEDPLLAMAMSVDDLRESSAERRGDAVSDAPPHGVPENGVGDGFGADFALALAGAQRAAAIGGSEPSRGAQVATEQGLSATRSLPSGIERSAVPRVASTSTVVEAPRTKRLRDLDLASLLAHLDRIVPTASIPAECNPVVAVVGDLTSARVAATALAVSLGLDESDVLVARPESAADTPPWLEITTPDRARSRAERWRTSGHATVIVVELAPGREGHAWAASMLDAVAADQVRLVAKAWQQADHLSAKATALGGVDGLDLVEVDAAAEPELFLELDLAVLAIDGRRATSELWASLLYERRIDEHDDE